MAARRLRRNPCVHRYGSDNGFGWNLGDVIGAQIVTIPMSVPIQEANRAWLQLLLFLIGVMIVAILALDAAVYWFVIRPLKLVSQTADRVSRGEKEMNPVRVRSKDEIATVVASSFNRMQVSLTKALKMVEEDYIKSGPSANFGRISEIAHGRPRLSISFATLFVELIEEELRFAARLTTTSAIGPMCTASTLVTRSRVWRVDGRDRCRRRHFFLPASLPLPARFRAFPEPGDRPPGSSIYGRSARISTCTSDFQRACVSSTAFLKASSFRSSGSSSAIGIFAPRTSTGTTGISRRNADASSIRTKSFASSNRLCPCASLVFSHSCPIIARRTVHDDTLSSIALRKSRPGSIAETSMKTEFSPNCFVSSSKRRPASPSESYLR